MKTQSVNCDIHLYNLDCWKGKDIQLPPNSEFTLVIDYPLRTPVRIKMEVDKEGLGFIGLVKFIVLCYKKIYKTYKKDNKYGIWGHCIEDLVLEAIHINHEKKEITLGMGS